ncbi:hypothetical protein GE21DRAFT_1311300 [Neurospora crassa]|nr:hypothetical protein GE21DRAFT_1311300 [Neurospora crassa]
MYVCMYVCMYQTERTMGSNECGRKKPERRTRHHQLIRWKEVYLKDVYNDMLASRAY